MCVLEAYHLKDGEADTCAGSRDERVDRDVRWDDLVSQVHNLVARGTVEEDPANPKKKATNQ